MKFGDGFMTPSKRLDSIFSFNNISEPMPLVEWATWWDETLINWRRQGLPENFKTDEEIMGYLGLDLLHQFWLPLRASSFPKPAFHGGPVIEDFDDYRRIKKQLFGEKLLKEIEADIKNTLELYKDKDPIYWFTLEGFFWFPRSLLGIEGHLLAFYDFPDLMHEINGDLCDFHKKCLDLILSLFKPKFMTFAEDMSYNGGPMLSKAHYDEFILPYYKDLVPRLKENKVKIFIDTDGFVEPLIPWFLQAGIEGVLPLERMAGVDVNRIRQNYPDFLMIGGFDKTVMHKGEEAMRIEFERLLPALASGGYLLSVDHQTPPDVSLENYRLYVKLMREYSQKALEIKP